MSGGQFSVPLVVRMATGGGRQMAAQHAHSLEGWYAHVPGIKALAPATVADAYGMVLAALRDPDPVFLFEHATLYPMTGELDRDAVFDAEHAAVRREGGDITLVTYGASLGNAWMRRPHWPSSGIDAEVVDLRSLRPLDIGTVIRSLEKTHRVVIVDEGWRTGSLAAEIVHQMMERASTSSTRRSQRVCSAEVPMPYAKHLEDAALPAAGGDRGGGARRCWPDGRVRDAEPRRRHGAGTLVAGGSSRASWSSAATSSPRSRPTRAWSRSRSFTPGRSIGCWRSRAIRCPSARCSRPSVSPVASSTGRRRRPVGRRGATAADLTRGEAAGRPARRRCGRRSRARARMDA